MMFATQSPASTRTVDVTEGERESFETCRPAAIGALGLGQRCERALTNPAFQ
jgi:hypothetical protein